ncbi:Nucleotide-binding, alpha-beta plait [Cynara cardunculus var. scolymus]|uniref:Nucleotide-binding, alpha-beta plait n=1 Tax=Cynara cardunculus var. scolymus TaxID=59895 RepID=A0A118JXP6_CYNCS|nr:Nucleotide-binding, alpha-beta plait [Cynara cardunculus var. scolymus]
MADSREIDDQVDFEDDNYEEMDDDVEEQLEEEGPEGGDDENGEEQEDISGYDGKEQESEEDRNQNSTGQVDDEEKFPVSGEDNKGKHAELLALPPHGSEIFIGGLPRDVVEEDLSDLCESFGDVVEVRLVKNRDTNENKGFAFVAFRTKDVAQKAIEELHNKEFKGRTLRCSLSETKYRLFIGNVPKTWTDDDFRKIIEETGPGSEVIELIKVKALYVKNIPENTPIEQLKELFQRHGEVTKVVMPPAKAGGKRDFGFVHFAERASALKAVKETEKYEIDGQVLEVVLAKPQSDRKPDGINSHYSGPHPNYIPHPVYGGFSASPYGGTRYGVNPSFQQVF